MSRIFVLFSFLALFFLSACGGQEETTTVPRVAGDLSLSGPEDVALNSVRSIGEVLDEDGYIDLSQGFEGSFDPHGFEMILDANGLPTFRPMLGAGLNDHWVSMNDDTSGAFTVYAVAVLSGDVYVGGDFTTIDGVAANYIAKWNGTTWSTLGTGTNATVSALAVSGTDLYVGGNFTQAGGASARRVARWNGTAWSPLGVSAGNANGAGNAVFALAVSGTNLYVGGQFTDVRQSSGTDVTVGRIARWDTATSSWSRLGGTVANNGFNNIVRALAFSGTTLYAGGQFTSVRNNAGTNVTVNRIAQWDGTTWARMGGTAANTGFDNVVYALTVSNATLYAGGQFTQVRDNSGDYMPATRVTQWDGTTWASLTGGGMTNNIVYALAVAGTDLYAAGTFTSTDGGAASRIAKWNGTAWSAMGGGLSAAGRGLAADGSGNLYAGGLFVTVGNTLASRYIARYITGAVCGDGTQEGTEECEYVGGAWQTGCVPGNCNCDIHYTANGAGCDADTQIVSCTNSLPANAHWITGGAYIGDGTLTQTWGGSDWTPATDTCTWECDTDYTLEGGACINSKEVPCDTDNANPANSSDTIANVTITYTTAGGWTAPALCAWTCDTDYALEGGACINSKEVPCDTDNANPANSSDTIANVTITYTTAGGWTDPALCAWTCDTDYALEGGACINSKEVPCDTDNGNPANSTDTIANVTITYTTAGGWTDPALCAWTCDTDYALEGGACINSKEVPCDTDNGNPANSSDTIANVTITYTTAGGWTAPALCAWTCDTDYALEGGACINSKEVPCDTDNGNPANSSDTIANVTVTYTTAGGWTAPALCAWTCDTDYALEGGACINSKEVPCDTDNGNPANSSDTIANVTITYTTAGGWTDPALCAWTCDTDYALEGGACINSKEVPCDTDNGNPANSSDTIANVTITYTTAGGWTAPALCAWTCDTDYTLEGGACINQKDVQCDEDNANPANSSDTIANVTIHYTTLGGWEDPADCAWTCDTDYALVESSCIDNMIVSCNVDNDNPANSSDVVVDVTIHYTTLGGWETPAYCEWICDAGLFLNGDGTACVECLADGDCNDDDACTGTETCDLGVCVTGDPLDCTDSDICTDDSCDPLIGCVTENNTAPCDDGNDLTENDACFEGDCTGDLMAGVCGNAIPVGVLPYTTTANTATRPNSLEDYGADCAAATQATVDVAYELTVETGVEYQIQIAPTDSGDFALNLLGVCGEGEACLAMANDGGAGETEYLTYTAAQSGTVYLAIEGSGAYELSIALVEQPDDDSVVTDDVVTDDVVTDDVVTDETVTDETVTDETVTDETVTDGTVIDETVTDETVTDETVTDETVTDETVTDTDTTGPDTVADKDTVVTDTDTVVTDNEQPDETVDETGDGPIDDSDLLETDDFIGPKGDKGCGCTMIF